MSFLAPLYLLGGLAIAGPIIFHLIRKQPKGEVEFSSLMFLEPTPPRLTRRSRLENLPLLLLRCLAILLMAFAFMRPFIASSDTPTTTAERSAIVLLVDTSASMRRDGYWENAVDKAKQVISAADDESIIAVVGFDHQPQPVLSLSESYDLPKSSRKESAIAALENLSPSWHSTRIGSAIRFAADQSATLHIGSELTLSDDDSETLGATIESRIVLISDMQAGAEVQSLQGYQWPDNVWLDTDFCKFPAVGNATLRVVGVQTDSKTAGQQGKLMARTQVSHHQDTGGPTFRLRFEGQEEDAAVVQVPAGESRVVAVPLPDADMSTGTSLQLLGDDQEFDNRFYFVPPKKISQTILLHEPNSQQTNRTPRDTPSFYLAQIPWSNSIRTVNVEVVSRPPTLATLSPEDVPLVVLTEVPAEEDFTKSATNYLRSGGRMLISLSQPSEDPGIAITLGTLLQSNRLNIDEAKKRDFSLIGRIDFRDSLIEPLSEPGVSDFSNVKILRHRALAGLDESADVILELDNGAPLLVGKTFASEATSGRSDGRLWVLTCGWHPEESQLGLSTKFVPLMLGMIGDEYQSTTESIVVGQNSTAGDVVDQPGLRVSADGDVIATNISPNESDVSPIDEERLQQLGASLSSIKLRQADEVTQRALRDVELESRQAWWQWLLLATVGVVAVETLLSAKSNGQDASAESQG